MAIPKRASKAKVQPLDELSDAVLEVRNEALWDSAVQQEKEERANLRLISENYQAITDFVDEQGFVTTEEDDE